MGKYGKGTVTERKGRYRARCCVGGRVVSVGTFDTPELAQEAIDATLRKVAESPVELAGDSLQAFHLDWLAHRARDGHHRDVENDGHASKRWANADLGKRALVSITSRDVRQWVGEQVALQDCERQTLQNSLNLLRQCLEHACQRGRIDANPAVGVRLPKMERRKQGDPWTWLTAEEVEKLLKGDDELRDQIAFAIFSGCREGEQFGLRWADIDLRTGVCVVRNSWPGKRTTKAGKTRRAQLLGPALDAVERQRARKRGGLYVWPQEDGKPHSKNTFKRIRGAFKKRVTAAEIARSVRWHDLRHTCAAHLVQGTWAPELVERAMKLLELAEWIGHGKASCTERYAHLCPDAVGRLVRQRKDLTKLDHAKRA